jgi:hypothetical protein
MIIPRRVFIKNTGAMTAGLMILPYAAGAGSIAIQELTDLLIDKDGNSIKTLSAWEERRKQIRETWATYLGLIKTLPVTTEVKVLHEEKTGPLIRQLIEYENEPGELVQAYLLIPDSANRRLPGVVALHSTSDNQMLYISGVEKGKIVPLGYHLAQKGYVVICPMCFLWRDRDNRTYEEQAQRFITSHPGSKGMAKMLFDAMRAVDVLVSLDMVEGDRIGAMGHSLGGKEAFYLGAFDDRINVIVSNEGGIGIDFSNWDDPWYLGKEIHNFDHQHHELLALCAPKPFLLIGGDFSDGVRSIPYIEAVRPVYSLYDKPDNIELYNHGTGHNITPEAEKLTYDWIVEHL